MLHVTAPRLLVGRGIANHPGLLRAIRDVTPSPGCTIALHHTSPPGADISHDVDVFIPERGKASATTDAYIDDLIAACDVFGATHVWPGRELSAVFARAGELNARGITLLAAASADVARLLDDKHAFAEATVALDIHAPRSLRFTDVDGFVAAYEAIRRGGDRVCVKPVRGVFGRGFRVIRDDVDVFNELFEEPSYRIDFDDAVRRFRSRPTFTPMVAMPWLDGHEWSVDCFRSQRDDGDGDGDSDNNFVAVPRRKPGSDLQVLDDAPAIVGHCRTLARHFALRGVFNCQFKAHRGVIHVLEINARPAGAIGLTRHAGVNLIGLAWQEALGLPLGNRVPRVAVALRSSTTWSPDAKTTRPAMTTIQTATTTTTTTTLPTGTLTLTKHAGPWSLDALVAPGARRNPRRPFLLVSRVLGKHLPVTPSRMADAHEALAHRIPEALPGPVCFVGLAETATGLAFGVFEAWRAFTGRDDAIFFHSTRSPFAGHELVAFDEPHSHGPSQVVCVPAGGAERDCWLAARTLVVVDDELTTGTTLLSLRDALQSRASFEAVHAVTLVTSTAARTTLSATGVELTALADIDVDFAAIGEHNRALVTQGLLPLAPNAGLSRWGRAGTTRAPTLPTTTLARAAAFAHGHGTVYIVGTGECMHPAFVLGMALERRGVVVLAQATTRSPVLLGGAIRASLDLDVDGSVPFFLHNPPPKDSCVIVVHEPGAARDVRTLVDVYGALAVEVWDDA